MDLSYILDDIVAGLMGTVDYWMANPIVAGIALAVIVIAALFMSDFGQLVSTTVSALFFYALALYVWGAANAEPQWDFVGQIEPTWNAFTGLGFFEFFIYFVLFAVAIGIINLVKGMVSG